MTIAFFVMRVLYVGVYVQYKLYQFGMFNYNFKQTYPPEKYIQNRIIVFLNIILAVLNVWWFYKILKGLIKMLNRGPKDK